MSLSNWCRVVHNHAGMMEQSLHDIHSMLCISEMLLQFFHATIRIGQYNIIPRVDVNLVKVVRPQIRGKNGVFNHFRINTVDERFLIKTWHKVASIQNEFLYIGFQLVVLAFIR